MNLIPCQVRKRVHPVPNVPNQSLECLVKYPVEGFGFASQFSILVRCFIQRISRGHLSVFYLIGVPFPVRSDNCNLWIC